MKPPVGLAVAAVMSVAGSALADPLPDAFYSVGVQTQGLVPGASAANWGNIPMNVHGDWQGVYYDFLEFSIQGSAEGHGGTRPMATATAEAHGTVISTPISFGVTSVAVVEYFVRPRQIRVPPGTVPSIPAYMFIRGHSTGYASSRVTLNYLTHYGVTTTSGTQQYDQAVTCAFDPINAPYAHVRLAATAEAVADPLFVFDQETFDAEMGPATFNLAEYFEFEYSLGIVEMPPTPCDPDYDLSGSADQDDVVYLINVIAGGDNSTGRDPDFDLNGNADQDDVVRLIDVVAGAGC